MDFIVIATLVTILLYALKTYINKKYQYWKNRNVPSPEPTFPFGTMENPFKQTMAPYMWLKQQYEFFKSKNQPFGGLYFGLSPGVMIIDPELIKRVLTQDFHHFVDRGVHHDEKSDPLSCHLFSIEGQKWRNIRAKLTPAFTSGKLKMMFEIFMACSNQMLEKLEDKKEGIEMKEIVCCYTTDIIGRTAFGLECNSFEDQESKFRYYGKQVFVDNPLRIVRIFMINVMPAIVRFLGMTIFEKSINNFFLDVVKKTVKHREENDIIRNDLLQILIDFKKTGMPIEEVAAESFGFFLAGFETSSTTMNFCMFELAQNEKIQEKVRDEIKTVLEKYDGQITYESLAEMKYLGRVLEETLRKYPPLPMLFRKCIKDYKIPDSDVTVEKGTRAWISLMGLHYDPDIYPEPEKFDPDRFTEENKANRHPSTFLSFGEGPRMCIGVRFGLLQTKIGVISILRKYRLTINARTILPVKPHRTAFLFATENPIYFDTEKIVE